MESGNEIVAFPSNVGISEFWSIYTPFTLNLKKAYDISNVTITMTNLKSGEVLEYKTNYNIYTIDEEYAGAMQSLSWGLGHPGKHGDQYNIKVSGVKKDGKPYPIEYTVNFISLEYGHTN